MQRVIFGIPIRSKQRIALMLQEFSPVSISKISGKRVGYTSVTHLVDAKGTQETYQREGEPHQ